MANVFTPFLASKPLYMQTVAGDAPINYSADEFRNMNQVIWYSPGICTPTSFLVEQADTAGWRIKVRAGYAATQGYFIVSGSDITIDVSSLNTNPAATRTHRVYLLLHDKSLGLSAAYGARLAVAEDTGAGADLPPSNASILLATFTISPGQSSIQNSHITAKPRNASQAGPFHEMQDFFRSGGGFSSAHTVIPASPARFRVGAGRVQLSGAIKQNSGSAFLSSSYDLGTLPLIAQPRYDQHLVAPSSAANPWRLYIAKDGSFTATINSGDNPLYLYLDGITYEID